MRTGGRFERPPILFIHGARGPVPSVARAGLRDVLQVVAGAAPADDLDPRLAIQYHGAARDTGAGTRQRGPPRPRVRDRIVDDGLVERLPDLPRGIVTLAAHDVQLGLEDGRRGAGAGQAKCVLERPLIRGGIIGAEPAGVCARCSAHHVELPTDDSPGVRRPGQRAERRRENGPPVGPRIVSEESWASLTAAFPSEPPLFGFLKTRGEDVELAADYSGHPAGAEQAGGFPVLVPGDR